MSDAVLDTYAGDRVILDSDAHIMEPPGWLESFAPESVRDRLAPMDMGDPAFVSKIDGSMALLDERRTDPDAAAAAEAEFMTMPRKGWGALGDHDLDERRRVLDLFGFVAQLVFPTGSFPQVMSSPDDVFLDAVEAMNRGMAAFCDGDRRMLSVAYVPMQHTPADALRVLRQAIDDGCDTVMVDAVPPRHGTSPTHPDFDPVWASFAEFDVPVMLHVGLDNGHRPVPPSFFDNGRELPHFRSDAPGDALSFMAIGSPAQLFIAAMIFDGVLDRHPGLRFGVSELGATWVPSFLPFLDTAARSFRRLQDLSHLDDAPSEYVRRHFCFSPFAGEDVGFMIETAGHELFMFSSDYPHHEGTDDPLGRYERTMAGIGDQARASFHADNFARILGPRLCAQIGHGAA